MLTGVQRAALARAIAHYKSADEAIPLDVQATAEAAGLIVDEIRPMAGYPELSWAKDALAAMGLGEQPEEPEPSSDPSASPTSSNP